MIYSDSTTGMTVSGPLVVLTLYFNDWILC